MANLRWPSSPWDRTSCTAPHAPAYQTHAAHAAATSISCEMSMPNSFASP
jgi:hypothetical protein